MQYQKELTCFILCYAFMYGDENTPYVTEAKNILLGISLPTELSRLFESEALNKRDFFISKGEIKQVEKFAMLFAK